MKKGEPTSSSSNRNKPIFIIFSFSFHFYFSFSSSLIHENNIFSCADVMTNYFYYINIVYRGKLKRLHKPIQVNNQNERKMLSIPSHLNCTESFRYPGIINAIIAKNQQYRLKWLSYERKNGLISLDESNFLFRSLSFFPLQHLSNQNPIIISFESSKTE